MKQQGDIKNIDWYHDDGVNIPMINDLARNHFYDHMIRDHVQDRNCIDIGFGTGLLSMMALRHGARHITAFENNTDRFALGEAIIRDLQLQDRIELINERFEHAMLEHFPDHVVFTETVNGSLFQEGLWFTIPRTPGTVFLPNLYSVDFYVINIDGGLARLISHETHGELPFHPGVDVDTKFINVVNHYRSLTTGPAAKLSPHRLDSGLNKINFDLETLWGHAPTINLARSNNPSLGYSLDATRCYVRSWQNDYVTESPINFSDRRISLSFDIDCSDKRTVAIVPRASIGYKDKKLWLDQCHWGPMDHPILIHDYRGTLTVSHDLRSGQLHYKVS